LPVDPDLPCIADLLEIVQAGCVGHRSR
jgi:hypothetical protein